MNLAIKGSMIGLASAKVDSNFTKDIINLIKIEVFNVYYYCKHFDDEMISS
jgi:hypothetical protein